MNNNTSLKIVVADSSVIVRSGMVAVLKRIPDLNAHPIEVTSPESLHNYLQLHTPDIIVVTPTFGGWFDLRAFKANTRQPGIKYVALICSVIDSNVLRDYDDHFSIIDELETIASCFHRLLHTEEDEDEKEESDNPEALSQREKEIITCVVKGMTNKAIADKLCLSIHTVITHRRNIARKLQIHSPAGLTIYAIVNKLVEIQDVKEAL